MDNLLPCPRPLKGRARALWFEVVRYLPITYMHIPAAEMFCFLQAELEEKQGRMGAARLGHLRSLQKELGFFGRGKHMRLPEPKTAADRFFNDDLDPGAA
jgi:hypothetical protein